MTEPADAATAIRQELERIDREIQRLTAERAGLERVFLRLGNSTPPEQPRGRPPKTPPSVRQEIQQAILEELREAGQGMKLPALIELLHDRRPDWGHALITARIKELRARGLVVLDGHWYSAPPLT